MKQFVWNVQQMILWSNLLFCCMNFCVFLYFFDTVSLVTGMASDLWNQYDFSQRFFSGTNEGRKPWRNGNWKWSWWWVSIFISAFCDLKLLIDIWLLTNFIPPSNHFCTALCNGFLVCLSRTTGCHYVVCVLYTLWYMGGCNAVVIIKSVLL